MMLRDSSMCLEVCLSFSIPAAANPHWLRVSGFVTHTHAFALLHIHQVNTPLKGLRDPCFPEEETELLEGPQPPKVQSIQTTP